MSWILFAAALIAAVGAAYAAIAIVLSGFAEAAPRPAGPDLKQVIGNVRDVLVGLLVGLATLFATIGGVRYILAGGDPSEVEAAKKTLKYAAFGYLVAVLAPVLVQILQHIVGTK